ncbi:MAG: hypothetical protein R2864_06755 [Syntrophotaleaceae bacterium]
MVEDPLKVQYVPDREGKESCFEFGRRIAQAMSKKQDICNDKKAALVTGAAFFLLPPIGAACPLTPTGPVDTFKGAADVVRRRQYRKQQLMQRPRGVSN